MRGHWFDLRIIYGPVNNGEEQRIRCNDEHLFANGNYVLSKYFAEKYVNSFDKK